MTPIERKGIEERVQVTDHEYLVTEFTAIRNLQNHTQEPLYRWVP
jgi:hypothetical protein